MDLGGSLKPKCGLESRQPLRNNDVHEKNRTRTMGEKHDNARHTYWQTHTHFPSSTAKCHTQKKSGGLCGVLCIPSTVWRIKRMDLGFMATKTRLGKEANSQKTKPTRGSKIRRSLLRLWEITALAGTDTSTDTTWNGS